LGTKGHLKCVLSSEVPGEIIDSVALLLSHKGAVLWH